MAQSITAIVRALGTLTLTGQPLNTETVVIGDKTYTFQTSLTDVDGNVLIGSDAEDSIDNLVLALTLGTGSGTKYAASMTANAHVAYFSDTATTLVVKARVAGTTETLTNGSWGAATLASGAGSFETLVNELQAGFQLNAAIQTVLENVEI
jgi:hypothetical protein